MSYHVDFASIALTDLRDYLRLKNWQNDERLLDHGLYGFRHPDHERRQLTIPIDASVGDYGEMVQRMIGKLAEIERRDTATIITEFQEMADDTLGIRINRDQEYISFGYTLQALTAAKELLTSAACTVVSPSVHHPQMNRREALELVNQSRFRHTEQGSFVLKISTPVKAMEQPQAQLFADMPFVRQATLALNKGITSVVDAVMRGNEASFVSQIRAEEKPVVSSNLCKAISKFQEAHDEADMFLQFRWAKTIPKPQNLSGQIKIPKDYYSRIAEIGQELKSQEEEREGVFVGTVEQLVGDIDEAANQRFGDVILDLYQKEGENVKAKAMLPCREHQTAIQAYSQPGTLIKIKGRLRGGNQPRLLEDVTAFEIIAEDA